MKRQVSQVPASSEALYPISIEDRIGDFSILHRYTPSVIQAIKKRYQNLLHEDDPTWYLHELQGRRQLENQDEKRFGYRLGVIAARIVINEKLLTFSKSIGDVRLSAPGTLPEKFSIPSDARYPLRQFYAPDGSVDIKQELRTATSHMLPEAYEDGNDWPAIGMGDTHALYGRLLDPSIPLTTESLLNYEDL